MASATHISVIDDDGLVLRSLDRLLKSAGFAVDTFASAQAFLERQRDDAPGCIILDLSLPGLSGLELQQALSKGGDARPVVFLSGSASVPSSVAAMKAGAVDFLTKPVDGDALLGAVHAAVEKDRALREGRSQQAALAARLGSLTPRESQVLEGVIAGKLNKQIAADLGTAEKTVKVHRARMMEKMQVDSVAELVRAWTLAWQPPPRLSS